MTPPRVVPLASFFVLRKQTVVILLALAAAGFLLEQVTAQVREESSGTVVQDSVIVKKVLQTVRAHVLSITKDRKKPLVIREKKKSRRFIVMGFLQTVTKNKYTYTAQIDADEYDHKIPRILYADVKVSKGKYRVTKIRIGPNHFRENDKK